MHRRDFIYEYTHAKFNTTFLATEKDAKAMFEVLNLAPEDNWKKEYVAEVWQIIGEDTHLPDQDPHPNN